MRRLLFHIGSHKTGTTTLQNALRKAQRSGKLGEWTYVHPAKHASFNRLVSVSGSGADMQASIHYDRLRKLLPADGDCVISTEMPFWMSDEHGIASLAKRLGKTFDDIKVVVYLRRQDSLALSHRKQVLMGMTAQQFYGLQISALPEYRPHMQAYFDYAAKLRLWENAFGEDNIVVRRFQRGDLKNGDTTVDFFSLLGIDRVAAQSRVNVAWSRSQILAGLWLRARGHERNAFLAHLKKIKDSEKLVPSRADAEAFLAHFSQSNEELARRYDPQGPAGYFDEDMTSYPERGNDDLSSLNLDLQRLERRVMAGQA